MKLGIVFLLALFGYADSDCEKVSRAEAQAGKVSRELVPAVQKMIDAGPGVWVEVSSGHSTGPIYQKGFSGGIGLSGGKKAVHLEAGGVEAFKILFGESNEHPVAASVLPSLKESDHYLDEVNSLYCFPLAIRGSAKAVGLTAITDPHPTDAAKIAAGQLVPPAIGSIGLFFQQGPAKDDYYWASNYLALLDKLGQRGISPDPGSRGEAFLIELRSIWELREWNYPYKKGFGPRELRNYSSIQTSLSSLYKKYSRDRKE